MSDHIESVDPLVPPSVVVVPTESVDPPAVRPETPLTRLANSLQLRRLRDDTLDFIDAAADAVAAALGTRQ